MFSLDDIHLLTDGVWYELQIPIVLGRKLSRDVKEFHSFMRQDLQELATKKAHSSQILTHRARSWQDAHPPARIFFLGIFSLFFYKIRQRMTST